MATPEAARECGRHRLEEVHSPVTVNLCPDSCVEAESYFWVRMNSGAAIASAALSLGCGTWMQQCISGRKRSLTAGRHISC
jgi:hypothetical protein